MKYLCRLADDARSRRWNNAIKLALEKSGFPSARGASLGMNRSDRLQEAKVG